MILPELSVYISHTCDLACDHCFTYNNLDWGGHFLFSEQKEKLQELNKLSEFEEIFILGGEPINHPELDLWMEWIERSWPTSSKWIVTNGRNLRTFDMKNPDWIDRGWKLEISAHSPEDLKAILSWLDSKSIIYGKFFDDRHSDAHWHYDLKYKDKTVGELSESWLFYKSSAILENRKSITWKGLQDKEEQHKLCPSKYCLHLLNGKFYRCPQQALLPYVSKTFQIDNFYRQIAEQDLGCYPEEFSQWIKTKDQAQDQCRLCDWGEKEILPEKSKIKKIKILKI
jgi:organic radical activating enzyme